MTSSQPLMRSQTVTVAGHFGIITDVVELPAGVAYEYVVRLVGPRTLVCVPAADVTPAVCEWSGR